MTDPTPGRAPVAPAVDHAAVAEALDQVRDLDSVPLSEHHDRLARAHEVLHEVLNPRTD